jgi:hypothetical protein
VLQTFTLITVGILLLFTFAIPFIWPGGARLASGRHDLFAPDRLAAVLYGVRILPFFFMAAADPQSAIDYQVRNHPAVTDLEMSIMTYGLVQCAGFLALLVGIRSRLFASLGRALRLDHGDYSPGRLRVAVIVSFAAGLMLFSAFLDKVGGLAFVLRNLGIRTTITAGYGYYTSAYTVLFTLGALTAVYSLRRGVTAPRFVYMIVAVLLSAALLSATGGRSSTVELSFAAILVWHYGVSPITRIRARYLVPILLIAAYIVVIPVLRRPGGYEKLTSDPSAFAAEVKGNLDQLGGGNSFVDIQVFVVGYFHPGNIWWGASYVDLLTAPLPRRLYPDKPPVDDGVYLNSLLLGMEVKPPMPFYQLSITSWPPSTFGIMYMNFWIPGVLAGMALVGVIYRITYQYLVNSSMGLFSIIVYAFIMWRFQLSNLNLVATGFNVATALLFCMIFYQVGLRRARHRQADRTDAFAPRGMALSTPEN